MKLKIEKKVFHSYKKIFLHYIIIFQKINKTLINNYIIINTFNFNF